jgi:hypothetical protein
MILLNVYNSMAASNTRKAISKKKLFGHLCVLKAGHKRSLFLEKTYQPEKYEPLWRCLLFQLIFAPFVQHCRVF